MNRAKTKWVGSFRRWRLLVLGLGLGWLACPISVRGNASSEYREQALTNAVRSAERTWRSLESPPPSLGAREVFMAALAYCEAGVHLDRLERLFSVAAQMQDRNSTNRSYGNLRWSWGHETVLDYNAVDFCMQTAAMIWRHHRDRLPPAARAQLRELIRFGLEGLRRHRVPEHYTNIALMNAGDLILLGESVGDSGAAEEGYARLERFLIYMWEGGTHEYDSPTYYGVDLDDLELIASYCARDRGHQQAEMLLEYFWTDIALNWIAGAQKLGGARSRDYDYLAGLGPLDQHLLANGWVSADAKTVPNNLFASYGRWSPAPELLALAKTKLPRYVEQVWGIEPAQGRRHYVCRDVSLSAAGAAYGGRMDLPLTVDLPGPRGRARGYFIADGRQDPYGKIKIPESKAHSKTLHLNPFWAAAQRKADALGVVVYREKDVNSTNTTLQSHFVFPVDVESFWIGNRQVKLTAGGTEEYVVPVGEALVLRQGSAAVGIKVPWACGCEGHPVSARLVNDGNPFGAARLTVDHQLGSAGLKGNPGASFWVRVGSELDGAAFERWRREFGAARCEVAASKESVRVTAKGVEGELTVAVVAPFQTPARIEPPFPRHLLAVEGEDRGRRLLESVEPLRSMAQGAITSTPVVVPDAGAMGWEAEQARLLPPFAPGNDSQASAGRFIWMPAEPGERAGSSVARASYRLNLSRAGRYVLWGRVLSPTPENDSFFVRAEGASGSLLEPTPWPVGVHAGWTWVRLNHPDGRQPLILALPAGDVTLQIRAREAGAKLDRLWLTSELDASIPK